MSGYKRKRSRHALVQAIYQWQMSKAHRAEITKQYFEDDALKKADKEFFSDLLEKVMLRSGDLDEMIEPHLDRPLDQLDPIERAILRLAVAELAWRLDVPFKVVVDEYIEQSKRFGGEGSHKYVNGVLDKIAQSVRKIEFDAAAAQRES